MTRPGLRLSPLWIGILAAMASPVIAQQPPDIVQSDSNANTAMGSNALSSNTTGKWNTASGASVLLRNTTGSGNTASGVNALTSNTGGSGNTATGVSALTSNTTGSSGTAFGASALFSNISGSNNAAFGYGVLVANTTGSNNMASGYQAMNFNTTGNNNTASGWNALLVNSTGSNNTAMGAEALYSNSTGNANIAVGYLAGFNLTGSNNIDIGNMGVAAESGTIRIGARSSQTQAFIAGIWGSPVRGNAVYVSPYGQLGVIVSSERYKTDIATMGPRTDKLDQLRPVTFRMKNEPQGPLQYGLVAEEVEKVYPELVIHNEDGSIEGVRYEELAPMLLNEVQQQRRTLTAQAERLAAQEERLAAQARQLETIQLRVAQVMQLEPSVQASLAGRVTVSRPE